jgi:hypothetical protein
VFFFCVQIYFSKLYHLAGADLDKEEYAGMNEFWAYNIMVFKSCVGATGLPSYTFWEEKQLDSTMVVINWLVWFF